MKVVQCKLSQGPRQLVCWLDQRPDLKDGVYVTLKDTSEPTARWKVSSVGQNAMEKAEIPRHGVFFESDI